MASTSDSISPEIRAPVRLPRITIKFCTQCKWMLRAAYFAQELLSTFSTSLGEVSLLPSTGGVFTVDIVHSAQPPNQQTQPQTQTTRLWDRKTEGAFPEVKHLKRLVRDIIDPARDLGHVDRHHERRPPSVTPGAAPGNSQAHPQEKSDEMGQVGGGSAGGTIAVDPDAAAAARGTPEGEAGRKGGDETCEDCG